MPLPFVAINIVSQNYKKGPNVKYKKSATLKLIQSIWLKLI